MATQDRDEKRGGEEVADEMFVEKVEQRPIVSTSREDAAMTRRILLKLDFRFGTAASLCFLPVD
jgi:hypothetical protein